MCKEESKYSFKRALRNCCVYCNNPKNSDRLFFIAFVVMLAGMKFDVSILMWLGIVGMIALFLRSDREEKKFAAIFLFVFCSFRMLLFDYMYIPSGSMAPGLLIGDVPIVNKMAFGYTRYSLWGCPNIFNGRVLSRRMPDRGDVIVFRHPKDGSTNIVKRVVAVSGDRVQVTRGVIFLNGEAIKQKFLGQKSMNIHEGGRDVVVNMFSEELNGKCYTVIYQRGSRENSYASNTPEFIVPKGYYFVMGDNRDNSDDSRLHLGMVPEDYVIGEAVRLLFSMDGGVGLFRPWLWLQNVRYARPGKKIV